MRISAMLSVPTLLAAAAAFASGQGLGTPAGAAGGAPASIAPASGAEAALQRASDLLLEGKFIQARELLLKVGRDAAFSLTDAQAQRRLDLVRNADRRMRDATPTEISLQKAELALMRDDLVAAEHQARAVIDSGRASAPELERAQALVAEAAGARRVFAPVAENAVRRAVEAFEARRYAEAKALLERVSRSGVTLSPETRAAADATAGRLVELELAGGTVFDTNSVALGMLEPGVIEPQPWMGGGQANGGATQVAAAQPEDAGEPEGVRPPAAQPAPQAQPQGEDLLTQARRAEAAAKLNQANEAFAANRLADAERAYAELLTNPELRSALTPAQLAEAETRRGEAQLALRGRAGSAAGSPLDTVSQQQTILAQQARVEFENQAGAAETAIGSGDLQGAQRLLAQAQLTVNRARGVLDQPTIESFNRRLDDLQVRLDAAFEAQRVRDQEVRNQALQRAQQEAQRTAEEARQRQISEALERVRQLQRDLRYEEAMQVVEQILFLDPNNPAGLLLRDIIGDTILYRQFESINSRRDLSYTRATLENFRATIAPENIIEYPDDWPAKSRLRGQPIEFQESAANLQVLETLERTRIPVDFNQNPLSDVLMFFRDVTGLNMDVDWEALEVEAGITRDEPVTLQLTEASVRTALDRVLQKLGLGEQVADWAVYEGILTISSADEILRRTRLEIYDVRDLLIPEPNFDEPPEFDLGGEGGGGGGGGGGAANPFGSGGGGGGGAGQGLGAQGAVTTEELLDELIDIIQNNVYRNTWVDNGGEYGEIERFRGSLIVTATPRVHRALIDFLGRLREIRALQIGVEARILAVDSNFFQQIGFDLDVIFNANSEQVQFATLNDPSIIPSDFFNPDGELVDEIIGRPAYVPGINPEGPYRQNPMSLALLGQQWSPIRAGQDSLGITDFLIGESPFASQLVGPNAVVSPALSVAGRFLDDIQVDFLVRATEADQRSVTLTAPRITFTNGQQGQIQIITQLNYIGDLEPVVGDSSVAFDPEIETAYEGVYLTIFGWVSADRRYVTMQLDIAQQTVSFQPVVEFGGGAAGGGEGGGDPATAFGIVQLPQATQTRIQTQVTVPDEGTLLLGGQRFVSEVEVESGVPVLSEIPILNRFFNNRANVQEERTLMVLIKPTVLIQNEQEERAFPGLQDSLGIR